MNENYIRQTKVYGIHFWDFYNAQKKEVQGKIDWVIGLVRTLQIVPEKFLKHLEGTDGLYEMRIKVGRDILESFAVLTKVISLYCLMDFRKNQKKRHDKKLKELKN